MQLLIQTNAQRQINQVGPARQAAFGAGQEEFDVQGFAFGFYGAQLPVHRPHQPVSRSR
ncbi:hypothetical protein D3C71_1952040 [compost metagenome]